MGYYTKYDIEIEGDDKDAIMAYIEEKQENGGNLYYGLQDDECKWYEHEEEMRDLSKQFPLALIKLYGVGEDEGDYWVKYFHNGLMQTEKGTVTLGEFNKNKLR